MAVAKWASWGLWAVHQVIVHAFILTAVDFSSLLLRMKL